MRREALIRAAWSASRSKRAAMVKLCEKRAAMFEVEWPALAASWLADAELIRYIGRQKRANATPSATKTADRLTHPSP